LEDEVHKLVADIQHSAWDETLLITTKVKGITYPQEIREKIAQKRKIRKRWQMTQDLRISTELNCITQDLRRTILETKQRSIEAYLREISDDSSTEYSLWKATKRLKRPTINIPPVRKQDRAWARNNKEKAENFAEHLERTFKPNEEKTIDTPRRIVEKQIKQIPPVTPNELLNTIKVHINPKKTPGFDVIRGALETTAQKSHSQTNTSIQCRIPTEICTSLLKSNGSDDTETRKACY
jgi:hypothetical protein